MRPLRIRRLRRIIRIAEESAKNVLRRLRLDLIKMMRVATRVYVVTVHGWRGVTSV